MQDSALVSLWRPSSDGGGGMTILEVRWHTADQWGAQLQRVSVLPELQRRQHIPILQIGLTNTSLPLLLVSMSFNGIFGLLFATLH